MWCVQKRHTEGKYCYQSFLFALKTTNQWSFKKHRAKTFTMILIDIDNFLPEDSDFSTLARGASATTPAAKPPDGDAASTPLDQSLPHQNILPLHGQNFIAEEAIGEAEVTMLEDIEEWIMANLATFHDLPTNQAKHRLQSMTNFILFMVMDEKSTRVKIFHSITYFSARGTTDNNIEGQAIGFCGDFMWDQLPKMIQVKIYAFKNIKVKVPWLLTISQSTKAGVLTTQTLLTPYGSWGEDTVRTLFPFPGAWLDKINGETKARGLHS